jgi:uncharacterized protein YjcR
MFKEVCAMNSFLPLSVGSTPCWKARSKRPRIDWPAIERDYRSGAMSLREMADKHGCSHSTIANCAGRRGWKRKSPDSVEWRATA